jgi:hypothetical protein
MLACAASPYSAWAESVVAPATAVIQSGQPEKTFTRATVHVLGVFSLRGFFNMKARLYQTKGLTRYKFNLRDSEMILDFAPGITVTPSEIRQIQIDAGYRPGPASIEILPLRELKDDTTKNGWVVRPNLNSDSAFVRWFKLNF